MTSGSSYAVALNKVSYSYKAGTTVLNHLNMHVPTGSIYGFLGANGAGKSTTLRLVLGLLHPEAGDVKLWGHTYRQRRLESLQRVGAMIESPSLYLHLSAYENLKITCSYLGVASVQIDRVLELTGLMHGRDKPCKAFSTGMKQRLGIANAMLHDPDLLVLDEPTNGLDPEGIIELRSLLQQLHQLGKTVLLSSHLLSEIEKIATHVGVVGKGQMLFEGPLTALQAMHQQRGKSLRFEVDQAAGIIALLGSQYELERVDDGCVIVHNVAKDKIPALIAALVEGGVSLYACEPIEPTLETDFLALLQDAHVQD